MRKVWEYRAIAHKHSVEKFMFLHEACPRVELASHQQVFYKCIQWPCNCNMKPTSTSQSVSIRPTCPATSRLGHIVCPVSERPDPHDSSRLGSPHGDCGRSGSMASGWPTRRGCSRRERREAGGGGRHWGPKLAEWTGWRNTAP